MKITCNIEYMRQLPVSCRLNNRHTIIKVVIKEATDTCSNSCGTHKFKAYLRPIVLWRATSSFIFRLVECFVFACGMVLSIIFAVYEAGVDLVLVVSSIMCYRTEKKMNNFNRLGIFELKRRKQRMSCTLILVYWTRLELGARLWVCRCCSHNKALWKFQLDTNIMLYATHCEHHTARRMDKMMVCKKVSRLKHICRWIRCSVAFRMPLFDGV